MNLVSKKSKSAKKLSHFEKLWNKAEKLKRENEHFRQRLDKVVQRIQEELLPAELEAAAEHIPLLKRLLTLGQRQSMGRWERLELNDWIMELIEPLMSSAQIDQELGDEINRYQAFNYGIELDEQSGKSFAEQIQQFHQQQEEAFDAEFASESEDERRARIEHEVEMELDAALGKAPEKPIEPDYASDLFGDELHTARQQAFDDYQRHRAELREQLIEEKMGEDKDDPFLNFDPFGGSGYYDREDDDFEDPFAPRKKTATAVSNEVFTRLFRATVAVLHPDRERDEAKQARNHKLMSQLLKARKQGDVMTVIELYQTHVGKVQGLTGQDEKQLITVLKRQIEQLKEEKEDYSDSSPLHRMAFEQFNFSSSKKTDKVFREHLNHLREHVREAHKMAARITSLKKLKPYLEARSEETASDIMFEQMMEEILADGPFGFSNN